MDDMHSEGLNNNNFVAESVDIKYDFVSVKTEPQESIDTLVESVEGEEIFSQCNLLTHDLIDVKEENADISLDYDCLGTKLREVHKEIAPESVFIKQEKADLQEEYGSSSDSSTAESKLEKSGLRTQSPISSEIISEQICSISTARHLDENCIDNATISKHQSEMLEAKEEDTTARIYKCRECDKSFSKLTYLKLHMKVHSIQPPISCSQCNKVFATKTNLKVHMNVHTGYKPFTCNECGKQFSVKSHLRDHMFIHSGHKPFSCSECGKFFSLKGHLKVHMKTHCGQKLFPCNECDKVFSYMSSLQRHKRIHSGKKLYCCNKCEKVFTQMAQFEAHMNNHFGLKPFSCNECGKTFSNKSHVKVHMIIHSGLKPFSCNDCGKLFTQISSLNVHKKAHRCEKTLSSN